MIYLYVAAVAALYLSILIFVPTWAKKRNRHPLPWVLLSMAILFVGSTQDWIPNNYYFYRKCNDLENRKGSFLLVEQLFPLRKKISTDIWKQENASIIKGINQEKILFTINTNNDLPRINDYEIIDINMLNFIVITKYKNKDKSAITIVEYIIDRRTGEPLDRSVRIIKNVNRNIKNPFSFFMLYNMTDRVCNDIKFSWGGINWEDVEKL